MNRQSHTCKGGCTCGHVRYQVNSKPLIVHCCHCRGCQKNSGSAFALNALFEADQVNLISGDIEEITVPTPSGVGQIIGRCSKCKVAVRVIPTKNGGITPRLLGTALLRCSSRLAGCFTQTRLFSKCYCKCVRLRSCSSRPFPAAFAAAGLL